MVYQLKMTFVDFVKRLILIKFTFILYMKYVYSKKRDMYILKYAYSEESEKQ